MVALTAIAMACSSDREASTPGAGASNAGSLNAGSSGAPPAGGSEATAGSGGAPIGIGAGASAGGSAGSGGAGPGVAAGAAGASAGAAGASAGAAGTGAGGASALSFQADIWPVYTMTRDPPFVYPGLGPFASCVDGGVCHGGSPGGAGLSMTDTATAYSMLIDVPSTSSLCGDTLRVAVGSPEQSCLIRFYEGRLRDELEWVSDAEIDLMRTWITQGALP
jgi:hypothetical protein